MENGCYLAYMVEYQELSRVSHECAGMHECDDVDE